MPRIFFNRFLFKIDAQGKGKKLQWEDMSALYFAGKMSEFCSRCSETWCSRYTDEK